MASILILTSGQTPIALEADNKSLQIDSFPLTVSRVTKPRDLPSLSTFSKKPSEINHSYHLDYSHRDGGDRNFLPLKTYKLQCLPHSLETRSFQKCHSPGQQHSGRRNSEGSASDKSTPKDYDFQNESKTSVPDYRELSHFGVTASSCKEAERVKNLHCNVDRDESVHFNSSNEQTMKAPRKLIVSLLDGSFSMHEQTSPPESLNRRKSENRSSLSSQQNQKSEKNVSQKKKNTSLGRPKSLHNFRRTPNSEHVHEQPRWLMLKQSLWNPDLSIPKPPKPQRIRLQDFFPQNFDILSVMTQINLPNSKLTRNPRLKRQYVGSSPELTEHSPSKPPQHSEATEVKKPLKKESLKLPKIRMRKVVPPSLPGALCFTLKKVNASHEEIKKLIENELGCKIKTLLFDPVYIRMGETDGEYKTMWIFTLEEEEKERWAIRQGIRWNGERSRVRYYDDVMREEHNAYKSYKAIQDEQESKGLGPTRKSQSLG